MHHFVSVCLSVRNRTIIQSRQKVTRQKFISLEPFEVGVKSARLPAIASCKSKSQWQVCSLQHQVASFLFHLDGSFLGFLSEA